MQFFVAKAAENDFPTRDIVVDVHVVGVVGVVVVVVVVVEIEPIQKSSSRRESRNDKLDRLRGKSADVANAFRERGDVVDPRKISVDANERFDFSSTEAFAEDVRGRQEIDRVRHCELLADSVAKPRRRFRLKSANFDELLGGHATQFVDRVDAGVHELRRRARFETWNSERRGERDELRDSKSRIVVVAQDDFHVSVVPPPFSRGRRPCRLVRDHASDFGNHVAGFDDVDDTADVDRVHFDPASVVTGRAMDLGVAENDFVKDDDGLQETMFRRLPRDFSDSRSRGCLIRLAFERDHVARIAGDRHRLCDACRRENEAVDLELTRGSSLRQERRKKLVVDVARENAR